MAHKFQELYEFLERRIPELLAIASPFLSESDIAEAKRFLNAGEYGLAVETIHYAATEANVTIPIQARELIDELALKMGITFDTPKGSE